MDQYDEKKELEGTSSGAHAKRWLIVAVVVLLAAAAFAFAYGYHQQALVGQLSSHEVQMNATVNDLQGQLSAMTAKLNEMTAAQEAAKQQAEAASAKNGTAKNAASKRKGPTDSRYKQLQAQLAEQQKQLKATQDEVAKNRADLEGNINSTRDELNGSIAKTHDELVALEKRGERSYFEFDLAKSKQFQRFGPLTLSLRRADAKHKNYDVQFIVDDNRLTKKRVNLYEPIWIHTENESQPVQVVVNRIEKNLVHGYVSAPKYKPSELATASTSGAVTPVSAKTPAPDPNQTKPEQQPPQEPPQQPEPQPKQP